MLQAETSIRDVARKSPIADSKRIGKVELCAELGWSRPKLDRRLESDPHFPVVYRGGEGKGRAWGFDLDAVLDYLQSFHEDEPRRAEIPESPLDQRISARFRESGEVGDVTPFRNAPVTHRGEETGRRRRDEAQAALLEDRLKKDRGQLVAVEDLRNTVSIMLMRLGKGLDALPDALVEKLNLPPAQAPTIRDVIYRLRSSMVADLQQLLEDAG